ncbi:MAG: histidine phosphatase family protein, partial [Deltaproteobacteria bacterium]|nr:histidine phosphatase family protein [Deltaproteobacteria bacterium]
MRFILVRHGETVWNQEHRLLGRTDQPLSPEGVRQARRVAATLRGLPIAALYSSPLRRALETARPLAEAVGLPVRTDEALLEVDHGSAEGLTREELRARHPEFLTAWEVEPHAVRFPEGESAGDVQARAWGFAQALRQAHARESVVAVTHNLVIKALVCRAIGLDLGAMRRLGQDPGGVTILEFDGAEPQLVVLNSTAHLR